MEDIINSSEKLDVITDKLLVLCSALMWCVENRKPKDVHTLLYIVQDYLEKQKKETENLFEVSLQKN